MSDFQNGSIDGRFIAYAVFWRHKAFNLHIFRPYYFLNFQKKWLFHIEPIYLADGTSSDTNWKRETRVVTVCHRGKRIVVSKEITHG